jgi:hypothetical protein
MLVEYRLEFQTTFFPASIISKKSQYVNGWYKNFTKIQQIPHSAHADESKYST